MTIFTLASVRPDVYLKVLLKDLAMLGTFLEIR